MSASKSKLLQRFHKQSHCKLAAKRHIEVTQMKNAYSFPYMDDIINTNEKKFDNKPELIICLLRHSEVNEYGKLAKSQMSNKQF